MTLIPAGGALAFRVSDWDVRVSDWAIREKPIYGTKESATESGEDIRDYVMAGSIAALLLTPSGSTPGEWIKNKGKGAAVEAVAVAAPEYLTTRMKEWTNRVRPNGKDDLSFPSFLSAETAAWGAMARRNLESTGIHPVPRGILDVGLAGATGLAAWARVENGSHYPSDVLAGVALGNFLSLFIHDAFLGPQWCCLHVAPAPDGKGIALQASMDL
jgi:hypothetical protein